MGANWPYDRQNTKKGKERRQKREGNEKKEEKKVGNSKKDPYSLLSDSFSWSPSTHFRLKQATVRILNIKTLPCLSICPFFFPSANNETQMILREIESNTFHEAAENHRETFTEKKRQGGVLPDLRLARRLGEVSKAGGMKVLTQVTPQKCGSLLHEHHNTEKICCVGVQPSHLKRDGDTVVSRKDFLSHFVSWRHLQSG